MIPARFEYAAPDTLEEALRLLERHGEEAKVLTGGQSLIPLLKLRLARPEMLVDLRKIQELHTIRDAGNALHLGACLTHGEIAASPLVQTCCPLLKDVALQIGDRAVRHAGTLGGSLVHADPASDWPAALLATGARLTLQSRSGERLLAVADWFVSMLESAIHPDEILTAIAIPKAPAPHGHAYRKVAQSASGFALAGVAVQITRGAGGIRSVAVGITGVAEVPYRARAVEQALRDATGSQEELTAAAARAVEQVTPLEDLHASSAYRGQLARVLTRRALTAAWNSAREQSS